jgi:hypothetical protein
LRKYEVNVNATGLKLSDITDLALMMEGCLKAFHTENKLESSSVFVATVETEEEK